jgi:hypothetical protein
VRRYAHVEYSNGFIIFDRQGESVEVWRRYNDARLDEDPERHANPDQFQLDSFAQAYKKCMDDSHSEHERHRGTFVPYAVLQQPQPTRAYRFVYPTLLLASSDTWLAFLWDVPSCSLTQTINISPSNRLDGTHPTQLDPEVEHTFITYVEQSERHIFICTHSKLLIFTRKPVKKGESALVAFFPGDNVELEGNRCSLEWDEEIESETPSQFGPSDLTTVGRDSLLPLDPENPLFSSWHNRFVAGKSPAPNPWMLLLIPLYHSQSMFRLTEKILLQFRSTDVCIISTTLSALSPDRGMAPPRTRRKEKSSTGLHSVHRKANPHIIWHLKMEGLRSQAYVLLLGS